MQALHIINRNIDMAHDTVQPICQDTGMPTFIVHTPVGVNQIRIRKAISVIKNRSGKHEETIRELRIDSRGLQVGEPLTDFQGVLTGTPEFIGNIAAHALLEGRDA